MTSTAVDQKFRNARIEQVCRSTLMENLAQRFAARFVWRAIGFRDLDHRQLEDVVEVLTGGGALVDEGDRSAIDEQSSYLPELVHVRDEESLCIVTTQQGGAVDHEEYSMALATVAHRLSRGID